MSTGPATQNLDTRIWLLRAAKGLVVFVYAIVLIDLVLLTLGFFLRLFGASTDAEFTRWVYRSVERIMEPFRGMFPTYEGTGTSVVDVSLLFAMVVYAIAALAFHALVVWLTDRILALRRRTALGGLVPPPTSPPNAYASTPSTPSAPSARSTSEV